MGILHPNGYNNTLNLHINIILIPASRILELSFDPKLIYKQPIDNT